MCLANRLVRMNSNFAGDDIRVLESGAQIVSGTPGRVFDMIKRRSLDTREMKILVLDEADEMLNKGFREQIYDVYRYLPPDIQVILVSATLPHDVLEMTHKFMQDPVRVLVKRDELTLEVRKHALAFYILAVTCAAVWSDMLAEAVVCAPIVAVNLNHTLLGETVRSKWDMLFTYVHNA